VKSEDIVKAEEVGACQDTVIRLRSGKDFNYKGFFSQDIDITDIAHSLSHLCRFTGHTNVFYSVAQHSLLVSAKLDGSPQERLVGLLHDAAEAYTNDLSSPLKAYLEARDNFAYRDLQAAITRSVYLRFGITHIPPEVRECDLAACVFEAEGFLGLDKDDLIRLNFPVKYRRLWSPWDPIEWAEENGDREPEEVEREFLNRFETLMDACGRRTPA